MDTSRRGVQAFLLATILFAFLLAGLLWSCRPELSRPEPDVGKGWYDPGRPDDDPYWKDKERFKRPVFPNN